MISIARVMRLWAFPRTRIAIRVVAVLGALGLGLVAVEPFLPSPFAPRIHVGWANGVSSDERLRLELAFQLARPEHLEGTAWRYDLVDPRPETVAALIAHPAVTDTHEIDRTAGVVLPGAPRGTRWIRS
ncbi:MAG: hypothetical protein ACREMQ_02960, partial [Longimicrobiales bacterium]